MLEQIPQFQGNILICIWSFSLLERFSKFDKIFLILGEIFKIHRDFLTFSCISEVLAGNSQFYGNLPISKHNCTILAEFSQFSSKSHIFFLLFEKNYNVFKKFHKF